MSVLTENKPYYVYAEYNPFWVYMGWWLYAISVEGLTESRNIEEWAQATWLSYNWRLQTLFEGLGLPKLADCPTGKPDPSTYCPAFMRRYPAGIVCQIKDGGRQFIPQESELIGDYLRIVRRRQLDHIAKASKQEEEKR